MTRYEKPSSSKLVETGTSTRRRAHHLLWKNASAPLTLLAAVAVLFVAVGLLHAPASALAGVAHKYERSFGPDCTESTHFDTPGAVAVDEANQYIYVADLGAATREVFRCTTSGAPAPFTAGPGAGTNHISGFSFDFGQGRSQLAVSPISQTFYVADAEAFTVKAFDQQGEPAKFTAGPAEGSNEFFAFSPCGVAADSNGDIYVAESIGGNQFTGAVRVLAPSGEEITSFETSRPCNLAVNAQGALYINHEFTRVVEKFTPSSFPVTPTTTYQGAFAGPGPAYSIALDPSNDDLYIDQRFEVGHSRIAQFDVEGSLLGDFATPGEPGELFQSEGVAVDGSTGTVYASDNIGPRNVKVFVSAPPNPPGVGESSVSRVAATSASVQAQINPNNFTTHYHFQYVTQSLFEENLANGLSGFEDARETEDSDLGNAGTAQSARALLSGLDADTTYLFRVVAENANNEGSPVFGNVVQGEEGEFHTFPAFSRALPDGRAYELVSPAAKGGEVFPPESTGQLGANCPQPGPELGQCLPGQRSQMTPMQSAPDGEAVVYAGNPFSAALSSTGNEYLGKRDRGSWVTQGLSLPLFTNGLQSQGYKAFSPDLSRSVIYQISPALSPDAPTSGGTSFANLYLRHPDGSLQALITQVPPNRSPGRHGQFDFEEFYAVFAGGNAGANSSAAFSHLIFQANDALTEEVDGIAPEAPEVAATQANLYEWFNGQLHLINVLPGNGNAVAGAVIGSGLLLRLFENETYDFDHAISDDGSRIFWSDASTGQVYVRIAAEMTEEIPDHTGRFLTASADGSRLLLNDGLLYNVNDLTEAPVDLTDGQGGFQGILGGSEDLARIYFVDSKALTSAAEENANHEHAIEGKNNLYAWHEGTLTFVGALANADNENIASGQFGAWKPTSADRLAQVSPDGDYLAFTSKAPLTGYDNEIRGGGLCHLPVEGVNCAEVFEYDASANELTCASCSPTGLRPLGPSNLSLILGGLGEFPAPAPLRQPGNLSAEGEGRLFFESQDTLSQHDTNGRATDVYEWEPNGVGSCKRPSGCIFLISSGHASGDSLFVDSTPSGKDVFFVTRQQLLAVDKNQQLDLYDARAPHVEGEEVGTRESEIAPCSGESCKGTLAGPPAPSGLGSAAFNGSGNVKPKKHKKHQRHHKKKQKRHSKKQVSKNNPGGST